jgi:sporulation protein YlmC with PRC-barrel domain
MNGRVDLAAISRRDVLDSEGKPLGRIRELFIDMNEGRVEYVTLRLQTRPPAPDRELVIPWSQFGIAEDGDHLELAISREILETVASRHPRSLSRRH